MKISDTAKDELLQRFELEDAEAPGIALYVNSDPELIADDDNTVTPTSEHPGWQLKIIATGHLPPQATIVVNHIRVFPREQAIDTLLDYASTGFTVNGCAVHTEEP